MHCTWSISDQLQSDLRKLIGVRKPSSIWVVCDKNTLKYCLPALGLIKGKDFNLITVAAGEPSKSLESCTKIWHALSRNSADRNALVLCLGGGMICDLGAFAASVYKRGVDYVLIPTTLLAMADACIGGKTGVDFESNKNQLGTFSQPLDVLISSEFLSTLPDEELLSGLAEIAKQMLCGNVQAWDMLRKAEVHRQNWPALIQLSLDFKKQVVEKDPFEKAERKILNAGHTIGHALESFFLASGNPQPHGYCVAAGLVTEARISVELGLLTEIELLQIEEFVYAEFGLLPLKKIDINKVLKYCHQDKKNQYGLIQASLIGPIGQCHINQQISDAQIRSALQYYLGA